MRKRSRTKQRKKTTKIIQTNSKKQYPQNTPPKQESLRVRVKSWDARRAPSGRNVEQKTKTSSQKKHPRVAKKRQKYEKIRENVSHCFSIDQGQLLCFCSKSEKTD